MLPEQELKIIINEAFCRRKALVTAFMTVNLVFLLLGLAWPNVYKASTSILVEDKRVIQPLMQGAAVTTDVLDRARLAREVIYGRKIMNQVMEDVGWLKTNPSPSEQDEIIDKLTKRTTITNVGKDLINVEYKDNDADRAYKTAQKLAELFISASLAAKAAESQSAYDFIEKQTEEYHDKLIKAEDQLKEFRAANIDKRPGSDVEIGARVNQLQQRIEQSNLDLKEAEVKKASLAQQISGEAELVTALSHEGQFRTRIAELQSRLETLRLSYHETYPDIIQTKQQIDDLKQAIADERQRAQAAKAAGHVTIDESVVNNPQYQQLKRELSQTQVNIDMLNARITEAKRELTQEAARAKHVNYAEATLAELTRDYTVNRDIYQDLLKRRENARVSMNMDKDKQGLTIKIQEPALFPREPSGLQFMHFVAGGLIFGIVLPLGLLYTMLQFDPRIRLGAVIADKRRGPMLGVVPHLWSPAETHAVRREMEWLSLAVFGTLLIIALTAILRSAGVL